MSYKADLKSELNTVYANGSTSEVMRKILFTSILLYTNVMTGTENGISGLVGTKTVLKSIANTVDSNSTSS